MLQAYCRYALPEFSLRGLKVLDIGCNRGAIYTDPRFEEAAALHGVDVDRAAIMRGRAEFPHLDLQVACAEHLPHDDASFDVVMSRVSLPYTYIPRALSEAYRVLRPGGRIFLSMHDRHHYASFFKGASVKRAVDLAYVGAVSLLLSSTGMVMPKPWNGRYETVQTVGRMRRMLERARFADVTYERWDQQNPYHTSGWHHAIYQARKP